MRHTHALQIKAAFRKKSLQCHPDLCPPIQRESAEQAFRELAEAYAILTKGVALSTPQDLLSLQALLALQLFWHSIHSQAAGGQTDNLKSLA